MAPEHPANYIYAVRQLRSQYWDLMTKCIVKETEILENNLEKIAVH